MVKPVFFLGVCSLFPKRERRKKERKSKKREGKGVKKNNSYGGLWERVGGGDWLAAATGGERARGGERLMFSMKLGSQYMMWPFSNGVEQQ